MTYTKEQFGKALLKELDKGCDAIQIAKWAFKEHFNNIQDIDLDLDKLMMKIIVMEEGPEFELSEKELKNLGEKLVNESNSGSNI